MAKTNEIKELETLVNESKIDEELMALMEELEIDSKKSEEIVTATPDHTVEDKAEIKTDVPEVTLEEETKEDDKEESEEKEDSKDDDKEDSEDDDKEESDEKTDKTIKEDNLEVAPKTEEEAKEALGNEEDDKEDKENVMDLPGTEIPVTPEVKIDDVNESFANIFNILSDKINEDYEDFKDDGVEKITADQEEIKLSDKDFFKDEKVGTDVKEALEEAVTRKKKDQVEASAANSVNGTPAAEPKKEPEVTKKPEAKVKTEKEVPGKPKKKHNKLDAALNIAIDGGVIGLTAAGVGHAEMEKQKAEEAKKAAEKAKAKAEGDQYDAQQAQEKAQTELDTKEKTVEVTSEPDAEGHTTTTLQKTAKTADDVAADKANLDKATETVKNTDEALKTATDSVNKAQSQIDSATNIGKAAKIIGGVIALAQGAKAMKNLGKKEGQEEKEVNASMDMGVDMDALTEQIALTIAHENSDRLFAELVEATALANRLKNAICEKYDEIAFERAQTLAEEIKIWNVSCEDSVDAPEAPIFEAAEATEEEKCVRHATTGSEAKDYYGADFDEKKDVEVKEQTTNEPAEGEMDAELKVNCHGDVALKDATTNEPEEAVVGAKEDDMFDKEEDTDVKEVVVETEEFAEVAKAFLEEHGYYAEEADIQVIKEAYVNGTLADLNEEALTEGFFDNVATKHDTNKLSALAVKINDYLSKGKDANALIAQADKLVNKINSRGKVSATGAVVDGRYSVAIN